MSAANTSSDTNTTQKQITGLTLLLLSIPFLYWATNMQEVCNIGGYFDHYIGGGSVCQFGRHSGIAIILAVLLEFSILVAYYRNNDQPDVGGSRSEAQKIMNKIIISFICFNAVVMLFILLANSGFSHYSKGYGFTTGLFERSLPYFMIQFTALGLLYTK